MAMNYYTLAEAARQLGLSEDELRRRVERRELRAFTDHGKLRFRGEDIDEIARHMGMGSDLDVILHGEDGTGSFSELKVAGHCRVSGAGEPVTSDSVDRPLLIGSHARCAVRVTGPGIAPLHCQLTWLPKGLYLFDLESGHGTLLDGQPIRHALVKDGQKLTVGSKTLTVEVKGDATEPAAKRQLKKPTTLALSALQGPHKGESAILPFGHWQSLGHLDRADLRLDREPRVCRRHVALKADRAAGAGGPLVLHMRRAIGPGIVGLNADLVAESAVAYPGDALFFCPPPQVSGTVLLVHYDLDKSAW